MIRNVCIAIPHDGIYVILDMEWKELDQNLQFVYGYKQPNNSISIIYEL